MRSGVCIRPSQRLSLSLNGNQIESLVHRPEALSDPQDQGSRSVKNRD
jgi:hypothetical protein